MSRQLTARRSANLSEQSPALAEGSTTLSACDDQAGAWAPLSYALITPVLDELENLTRLAASIERQTLKPCRWMIVDTGSTDETLELAEGLAERMPFVRTLKTGGPMRPVRGGPIVRGFITGVDALDVVPDIVVKLDADLSFEPNYFERLVTAFAQDSRLGLASGVCTELRDGEWRPLFGTRHHVWGACRSYRWACLQQVLPLEERMGWDEIDSIKAQIRGWRAHTVPDAPFRHHRVEGIRDGSQLRRWHHEGHTTHYMGYRFSYLIARAIWRARRQPVALALISGYATAALRHEPRCPDEGVVAHMRSEQRARRLPLRLRESLGRVL